ncbi:9790_t:CDS:1, partial [Dentiscutata heterogama]
CSRTPRQTSENSPHDAKGVQEQTPKNSSQCQKCPRTNAEGVQEQIPENSSQC